MNLIVFDCDGTLADSQHAIVAAMVETFAAEGLPLPTREQTLDVVGLSLTQAMRRLMPAADEALVVRLARRYKVCADAFRAEAAHIEPLFPGTRDALFRLAARPNTALSLATGKSREAVDSLFAREGLASLFSSIQTADTHPSKPHPSMLLEAMAETGSQSRDTVMVGDSTYDCEMAQALGVAFIGVTWGYHPPEALAKAGANVLVRDFPELEDAIAAHFATVEAAP